jgi:hypothetical protein
VRQGKLFHGEAIDEAKIEIKKTNSDRVIG